MFPWGVLRFGLDRGVQLMLQNPYPFLKVILAKIVPIFRNFSQNTTLFLEILGCFSFKHPKIWEIFEKWTYV